MRDTSNDLERRREGRRELSLRSLGRMGLRPFAQLCGTDFRTSSEKLIWCRRHESLWRWLVMVDCSAKVLRVLGLIA